MCCFSHNLAIFQKNNFDSLVDLTINLAKNRGHNIILFQNSIPRHIPDFDGAGQSILLLIFLIISSTMYCSPFRNVKNLHHNALQNDIIG